MKIPEMTPAEMRVGAAFYEQAGIIIDNYTEWAPEQRGRFRVVPLPGGVTPIIEFDRFPEGTILRLNSPFNGITVAVGLRAAAAIVAVAAMTLVLGQLQCPGPYTRNAAA